MWLADLPPLEGPENDYRLLGDELMRLMLHEQLFTFVTATPTTQPNGMTSPVAGTNNEAERTLRGAARCACNRPDEQDASADAGKPCWSASWNRYGCGCRLHALERAPSSLKRWWATGQSRFEKLVGKLGLTPPKLPVADQLLPGPSG